MEDKIIRNLGLLLYTKGMLINFPELRSDKGSADTVGTLADDIKQQEIDYGVALTMGHNPNPNRQNFVEWYLSQLRSLLNDCQQMLEVK